MSLSFEQRPFFWKVKLKKKMLKLNISVRFLNKANFHFLTQFYRFGVLRFLKKFFCIAILSQNVLSDFSFSNWPRHLTPNVLVGSKFFGKNSVYGKYETTFQHIQGLSSFFYKARKNWGNDRKGIPENWKIIQFRKTQQKPLKFEN